TLFAQGKLYELKYQLAKGTKITMTSTGEVNSVADQMGTEVLTDIYGDSEDIFVVLASNKKNGLTLEYEFGKRSQTVDSSNGSDNTDFSDLVGKKVKFVLLPNGKAEGFEGFDTLPIITTSTGDDLNEETYVLGVKTTFPLLPDNPVKFGDTWKDNQVMDIPTGGSVLRLENDFTYTLIEEVEKDDFDCLEIEMKGISRLTGDFEQGGMTLSVERETTVTGTIYFAYKEGMLISSVSESIGEGIIDVPAAGIQIPQTLTSKGSLTVKIEK
ncbi:MAG: DUF6263 family protein, partial [Candidatus Aminicenantes bacterium]|nr:DUF6263 family protein [Candidatus Aminicenantes bacterium]